MASSSNTASDKKNPSTSHSWEVKVQKHLPHVDPGAILLSDLPKAKSASALTLRHFLCLKVLWKEESGEKFVLPNYVDEFSIAKAKNQLDTPKARQFFSTVGSKQYPNDSIFSLVHLYMDFVFHIDQSSDWVMNVLLPPQPVRTETRRDRTPESPLAAKGSSSLPTNMNTDWDSDTAMEDVFQTSAESSPSVHHSPENQPGTESAADPKEFMPSEDEAIVNMALVLLLNSLTEPHQPMREKGYRWLPNHETVKIFTSVSASGTPPTGKENKLLEARTDGCFRHTELKLSAALLEVKPCVRQKTKQKIEWQEGAEMAAYLYKLLYMEKPPNPEFGLLRCNQPGLKRRLLVSQDHAEIYINIAEYDAAYEQYLGLHHPHDPSRPPPVRLGGSHGKGKAVSGTHEGFLMMRCFGPWRIDTPSDLKYICEALLAFSFFLAQSVSTP